MHAPVCAVVRRQGGLALTELCSLTLSSRPSAQHCVSAPACAVVRWQIVGERIARFVILQRGLLPAGVEVQSALQGPEWAGLE